MLYLCLQDAALFSHEDQEFGDGSETVTKNNPVTVSEIPGLLTVNQILESVSYMFRLPRNWIAKSSPKVTYYKLYFFCFDRRSLRQHVKWVEFPSILQPMLHTKK